jgi:hypothetical protein
LAELAGADGAAARDDTAAVVGVVTTVGVVTVVGAAVAGVVAPGVSVVGEAADAATATG